MHLNALPNDERIKQMLNCLAELGPQATSPLPVVSYSYRLWSFFHFCGVKRKSPHRCKRCRISLSIPDFSARLSFRFVLVQHQLLAQQCRLSSAASHPVRGSVQPSPGDVWVGVCGTQLFLLLKMPSFKKIGLVSKKLPEQKHITKFSNLTCR